MPNVELSEPFASAFELCKLQAQVDGAFDETLLLNWFQAAWDLCAQMVGFVYPPQTIKEPICFDDYGGFRLSYRPSSEVKIFDGYTLVATLPPTLLRDRCTPSFCCLCHPTAEYRIGSEICALPPRFVQAVARLFTYMVENRGDTELDPHVLSRCGAMAFLGPDVMYVA